MTRYSLPSADRVATALGAEVINGWRPTDQIEVTVTHADGTREAVALSTAAAGIIGDLLATLCITRK